MSGIPIAPEIKEAREKEMKPLEGLMEANGATSSMRVMAVCLVLAGIFVSVMAFVFKDKDAFDVMMVGGMLIGSGLSGKLVQKKMERTK